MEFILKNECKEANTKWDEVVKLFEAMVFPEEPNENMVTIFKIYEEDYNRSTRERVERKEGGEKR